MRSYNRNYHGTQPNKPVPKTKPSLLSRNNISVQDNSDNNENVSNTHHPMIGSHYWPPSLTDIIAFFMLLVTGALMWFTYGLYKSATEDSKTSVSSASAANRSATIAQQTLNEIKDYNTKSLAEQDKNFTDIRKYNDSSLLIQKAIIDSNSFANRSNLERTNKSLALQDSTLRETQREFEIENQPLLQIINIHLIPFEVNKTIHLTFDLRNFGKQPARLIVNKHIMRINPIDKAPIINESEMVVDFKTKDMYLPNGVADPQDDESNVNMNQEVLDLIKNKRWCLYIMGVIEFESTANSKKYQFRYNFRIITTPKYDLQSVVNEIKPM
jgi:hypothetical protein